MMRRTSPGDRRNPDGINRPQRPEPPRRRRNPIKGVEYIDYTDVKLLSRFTNDQGKMLPKRITGLTPKQQRAVTTALKYARHLALLPFVTDDPR